MNLSQKKVALAIFTFLAVILSSLPASAGTSSITVLTVPTVRDATYADLGTVRVSTCAVNVSIGDLFIVRLPNDFFFDNNTIFETETVSGDVYYKLDTNRDGYITDLETASSGKLDVFENLIMVKPQYGGDNNGLAGAEIGIKLLQRNEILIKVMAAKADADPNIGGNQDGASWLSTYDGYIFIYFKDILIPEGFSGDCVLIVDSPAGSGFPSGSVVVAKSVGDGEVFISSSPYAFNTGFFEIGSIRIKESIAGSFAGPPKSLNLNLPPGFTWDTANITSNLLWGDAGAIPDQGCYTLTDNNSTLLISIPRSSVSSTCFSIDGLCVNADLSTLNGPGMVTCTVYGLDNIASPSIPVAKYFPVIGTDPSDGALAVPVNKNISVNFGENIQIGYHADGITLKDDNIMVPFTYGINGSALTLYPTNGLEYSVSYAVYIPADAVTDSDGYSLPNSFSFNFTTVSGSSGGGGGGGGAITNLPVLKSVNLISQAIEEGTKLALTVRAVSNSPVDWINISLDGPYGNIFGGGHGCTFTEVEPGIWEYSHTFTVSQYAPGGTYAYKNISVQNKGMMVSEDWPADVSITINNSIPSEKPVLKSVNLISQAIEEGTKLTLTVRAESNSPVDWINISLDGPYGNIFGGGHGCIYTEVEPGIWEYSHTYTVSQYAPGGTYAYKNISVQNKGMMVSEDWPSDVSIIINNSIPPEKPVLTSVKLIRQVIEEGTQLTLTVRAESNSPVSWINISMDGPYGNIFGGGHGCTYTEVEPGIWEYSHRYTVSQYAPTGVYTYNNISVQNKGMMTSDSWPQEVCAVIKNPPTQLYVTSTDPVNGLVDIPPEAKVKITYNQDIYQGGYFDRITMTDSKGNSVAASVLINGRELGILPAADLQYNALYTVKIPEGVVQDINGNIAGSYTLSFTTKINSSVEGGGGGGGGGGGILKTSEPVNSTSGSATVTPSAGGTVGLGSEALVTIPANALQGNTKAEVAVRKEQSTPDIVQGFKVLGAVYNLTVNGQDHYQFNKPVTLTLTFDPAALPPGQLPVVHYYDEAAGHWVNLGGTVSGSTITITVDHFTSYTVLAVAAADKPAASMNDISGHWAEKNIRQLVEAGAISGYPGGTFKPDAAITRAQFAAVLVKALKLEFKSGKVFTDTAGHWAQEVVSTASAYEIINGYSAEKFGPDDPVTREQMAVMIQKGAGLATPLSMGIDFKDGSEISSWAVGPVAVAVLNGVIKGYPDGTFRPLAGTTRAEAVTVIVNAMK